MKRVDWMGPEFPKFAEWAAGRGFDGVDQWATVVVTRERALLRLSEGNIRKAREIFDAGEQLRVALTAAGVPMPASYHLPPAPEFGP